jgi:hypothetical protein
MKLNNITIGSDPEYAAFNNEGEAISTVGFIPGTKQDPHPMEGDWSCQQDNVGTEICIPICKTKEEFVHAMLYGRKLAEQQLQKMRPDLHLRSVSSARYSVKELDSDVARMFGCEASYCVYTDEQSARPSPKQVGNLRSFGCHIHIGYQTDDDVFVAAQRLIKAMDITCGLGSIIIDTDTDRRKIYGNAGDLRFRQIHDVNIVEYRTLGGAMHLDEERLGWVYDQTMLAIDMVNNWKEEYDQIGFSVMEAIDTGNAEACIDLIKKLNIKLPETYDVVNSEYNKVTI